MQYHYVVFYDTEKSKWFTELDTVAYFPDGNVWSDELADETGYGFFVPEDDTPEAITDRVLSSILYSLADVLPNIKDVHSAANKPKEMAGQLNFWEAE